MSSTIQWLDGGYTWNPVRSRRKSDGKEGWACVRHSPGCGQGNEGGCYAEKQNVQCGNNPGRMGTGVPYTVQGLEEVEIFLDEETLLKPLHWKKGRLVFPCSMTDWMADFVPDGFRMRMLWVMAQTPQHTYLTLTKRADRQLDFWTRWGDIKEDDYEPKLARGPEAVRKAHKSGRAHLFAAMLDAMGEPPKGAAYPLYDWMEGMIRWPSYFRNIWLGVSAENQKYWDERTRELNITPAFLRWVSCEPLLGEINCGTALCDGYHEGKHAPGIDWIVAGGESGPNSRGCNVEWIRSLVHQAYRARKPIFVKQLGAKPFLHKQQSVDISRPGFKFKMQSLEINSTIRLSDPKGGDPQEWPKDLQVRQYPNVETREAAHA